MYRLILARKLFRKGVIFCLSDYDIYEISHGLITLHDALDNFVGAIATQQGVPLDEKDTFLKVLDKIEKHEQIKNSFSWDKKVEMNQLNRIRNDIKHHGIMPNVTQIKNLIRPVEEFFEKYSISFFEVDWSEISLKEFIKDNGIQKDFVAVEDLIENKNFKEALDALALIKFKVFDERRLHAGVTPNYYGKLIPTSTQTEKLSKSKNLFLKMIDRGFYSDLHDKTDFLEKGIDKRLMQRFVDFTPTVGVTNLNDWEYIFDHGLNWSELNWTRDVCLFCYDFLVDAVIKNQHNDYRVSLISTVEYHTVKFTNEMNIYDKDNKLISTLKKDEERDVYLLARKNNIWEIFSENDCLVKIYELQDKPEIIGYFKSEDMNKIKFLKSTQYKIDSNGNLEFIKELI